MKPSLSLKAKNITTTKNNYNYNLPVTVISSEDIDTSKIKRMIEDATEGLSLDCFNFLYNRILLENKENTLAICDYISSLKSEINPSNNYRKKYHNLTLQILNILQKC